MEAGSWKIVAITITLVAVALSSDNVHECTRPCIAGEPPMTCYYNFHIEYYATLTKACWDCPNNITDCYRHHCIPGNGVHRGLVTVNRQLPGPSIQVCEGDEMVVDVKNHLPSETTTLHWHGQHMVGTPYMDGVPMLTQCPITPGATFRYRFWAAQSGTNYYHSHSGFQRADGVAGAFIIRQAATRDPHARLYDYDLPEHVILISDWLSEMGLTKFVSHHHDDGDNKPSSIIVNGMGRLHPENGVNVTMKTPFARFDVSEGHRYRFRLISNSILNCPIQVSVDNHTLQVIASDGNPFKPIEVESLVIAAGERFDFIINANQTVGNYWFRFHGLLDCTPTRAHQAAILHYDTAELAEPEGLVGYENSVRSGKLLNPMNVAPGDENEITVAELESLDKADETWSSEPDVKLWLTYDFYEVNNLHFHDPEHYPIFLVPRKQKLYTPQLNHISLKLPPMPPLSQHANVPAGMLCNETTVGNCTEEFCECTFTKNIPLGSLVELILIDEGFTFDATHPFHLHGAAFRILAMERLGSNTTLEEVMELDEQGLIPRKYIGAPIKDTVSVPDGGYVVIRFIADNPGYWLFHCHLSFHVEVGMGMVFKVGEHEDFPPVPTNFPTCGSWILSKEDAEMPPWVTAEAIVVEEPTTLPPPSRNEEENEIPMDFSGVYEGVTKLVAQSVPLSSNKLGARSSALQLTASLIVLLPLLVRL